MPTDKQQGTQVDLVGVIVAVTNDEPRVLVVQNDTYCGLPNGPFLPAEYDSLEIGLTRLVKARTSLDLAYVEQLYTFGNRYRDAGEIAGGPRVISVAYIALAYENPVAGGTVRWEDLYRFLPWEDWRDGPPASIPETIEPALDTWIQQARDLRRRRERADRVHITFGTPNSVEMDSVLALERFELLYEAGLIQESERDRRLRNGNKPVGKTKSEMGLPMLSDHRRILATALGRLRGKLAYRPVVFELLPGEFTLLQLQGVAEALSGARLHKQNFRRLVLSADLVEPIGRSTTVGRGRPAELFRFRREVLGEKLTVGISRPVMRRDKV